MKTPSNATNSSTGFDLDFEAALRSDGQNLVPEFRHQIQEQAPWRALKRVYPAYIPRDQAKVAPSYAEFCATRKPRKSPSEVIDDLLTQPAPESSPFRTIGEMVAGDRRAYGLFAARVNPILDAEEIAELEAQVSRRNSEIPWEAPVRGRVIPATRHSEAAKRQAEEAEAHARAVGEYRASISEEAEAIRVAEIEADRIYAERRTFEVNRGMLLFEVYNDIRNRVPSMPEVTEGQWIAGVAPFVATIVLDRAMSAGDTENVEEMAARITSYAQARMSEEKFGYDSVVARLQEEYRDQWSHLQEKMDKTDVRRGGKRNNRPAPKKVSENPEQARLDASRGYGRATALRAKGTDWLKAELVRLENGNPMRRQAVAAELAYRGVEVADFATGNN